MCKRLPALIVLLLVVGTLPGYALTELTPSPVPAGATFQDGHALVEAIPDYSNTTSYTGYYCSGGAGWTLADDVHRTTDLAIARIDFGYVSAIPSGTTDAWLKIFANNSEDSILPSAGTLLAEYPLVGLPVGGGYIIEVDLASYPRPLPGNEYPDLWIGLEFDVADTGLAIFHPPTVGTSHDDLVWHEDWGPGNFGPPPNPPANLCLATYPVPEPTGLLALSSGIIGLVALRRRR